MSDTITTVTMIATFADGEVARMDTDGEVFWLASLNGERLSEFCANKAQVKIQARRLFGRLAPGMAAGSVAFDHFAIPWK